MKKKCLTELFLDPATQSYLQFAKIMGIAFSSLSSFVQRWRNAFGSLNLNALVSSGEIGDSQPDENKNYMQIQGRCRSNDSELNITDQSENHIMRDEPSIESSNDITRVNNIQIRLAGSVTIGDHGTIISQQPVQRIENSTEVYVSMETEDRLSVDEETQFCTRTFVTNNITVHADNVAIGDGNEIKVQNSDGSFACAPCRSPSTQEETMDFDENRNPDHNIEINYHTRLFPSPVQLPQPGVKRQRAKVFEVTVEIINELYPLRDRAKWTKFELASNRFQTKYKGQPEINCFLLLEESVKLTYQKRLEEAKIMAEVGLYIVNNELDGASHHVLSVIANVASASIFRR